MDQAFPSHNPSFQPSRRRLLQIGASGCLGLTLPQLLLSDSASAKTTLGTSGKNGTAKSCIFIHQYGGLSQLDSWDIKPDAPAEIRGPYRPIQTATPGFWVSELMPKLAAMSEKYTVIRSLTHKNALHDQANSMMLAGKTNPKRDDPSLGAMLARLRPVKENIPAHVWLQKYGGGAAPPEQTYLSGGFLGQNYAPMLIGKRHDENPASPNFRVKAFDVNKDISLSDLERRWSLNRELEKAKSPGDSSDYDSLDLYHRRSFDLLHSAQSRSAFAVELEPGKLRDKYGRNPLGQNLLLARRLIEAGSRIVNVLGWTGLRKDEKFVSVETWDMHGNADVGIFEDGWNGLPFALPRTDQAVATLLEDLEDRGLLESTLVVLCGEFGRTPKISKGAKRIGRDHWPNCYSAMIAGGGAATGVVYGESDRQAAFVKSNAVSLEDFTATLFSAMDIPSSSRLSPNGFTKPASEGTPIEAILK